MNQKQRLLQYLQDGNTVTSLDGFYDLGITRISAVVHTLKKEGHMIITERLTVTNRYDEKCSICRWSLPCS
jgi:hypothetical protein